MAIYHFHASIVRRKIKQNAVERAAYIGRCALTDLNTGTRYNSQSRGPALYRGTMIPENSPEWLQKLTKDIQSFWSLVEGCEARPDSRTAREVEVALPHELTEEQRVALLDDFVRDVLVNRSRGLVANWAIHPANPLGEKKIATPTS